MKLWRKVSNQVWSFQWESYSGLNFQIGEKTSVISRKKVTKKSVCLIDMPKASDKTSKTLSKNGSMGLQQIGEQQNIKTVISVSSVGSSDYYLQGD